MAKELRTARLLLRQWREADLAPFARLNADPRVMEYFAAPLSTDESDEFVRKIRAHFDEHGLGLWAVEVIGVAPFAGFVGLARPRFNAHFTPCTEVGWRLAPEFWGNGYATEGARAVLAFAFGELRLDEVVSITAVGNRRSRAVMERLDMTRSVHDDFDHPHVPIGHPHRRQVLYRKQRPAELG